MRNRPLIPALILAGGLGTRLRKVVGELPKPLAPVGGRPFLVWLLTRLERLGFRDVYLSVGYKHERILETIGECFGAIRLTYIVEEEPLGTGGAIRQAVGRISSSELLVLNGDTLAVFDPIQFVAIARTSQVPFAMALAAVDDASRYGRVCTDDRGRIIRFLEKGTSGPGLINAGVYWMRRDIFAGATLSDKFSFETDFLGNRIGGLDFRGISCVKAFIDIGVAEDYEMAQSLVPRLVEAERLSAIVETLSAGTPRSRDGALEEDLDGVENNG